jgi:hypothetical protein
MLPSHAPKSECSVPGAWLMIAAAVMFCIHVSRGISQDACTCLLNRAMLRHCFSKAAGTPHPCLSSLLFVHAAHRVDCAVFIA